MIEYAIKYVFCFVKLNASGIFSIVSALATLSVSIVTWRATNAQKNIAANQFKLELYEKRMNILNALDVWIKSNKDYSGDPKSSSDIAILSRDISKLFPEYKNSMLNIAKRMVDIFDEAEKIDDELKMQQLDDDTYRSLSARLSALIAEGGGCWVELCVCAAQTRDSLTDSIQVPMKPY